MRSAQDFCVACDGTGYAASSTPGGCIDADCPTCRGYGSQKEMLAAERAGILPRLTTTRVPTPTPLEDLIRRILDGQMVVESVTRRHIAPDVPNDGWFVVDRWNVTFDPSLSREHRATTEAEESVANADGEVAY